MISYSLKNKGDILVAIVVLTVSALLITPVPTALIDILLTINIAVSILLLLVVLYVSNPLSLLSFPSLILLTTMFRLGLNVASARLILSQGDAGHVISSFGTMLIRGEIVVGIIIFAILTVVNFVVISRGTSRVSEVAARFALDALPGKQLAIDADLRSGIISPDQARVLREDLNKESQLYGSMDGAMRFIQGDAIAGIFIIFVNIVGGMYLGIRGGLSFSEAIETYSKLTIGDGLVSQIPALLISLCAGIVVTRVASSDNSTLGSELVAQLFARTSVLLSTGIILFLISLVPGIPFWPFFLISVVFIFVSYYIKIDRFQSASQSSNVAEYSGRFLPGAGRGKESLIEHHQEEDDMLVLYLDSLTLYKAYKVNPQKYIERWALIQNDFYEVYGLKLPKLLIKSSSQNSSSDYQALYKGVNVDSAKIIPDTYLVETHPENAPIFGLKSLKDELHPLFDNRVFWTQASPVVRRVLELAEIKTFDFFDFIALRVTRFFLSHPEEILSLTDSYSMIKGLEKKFPGMVEEIMNKYAVDVSLLTECLQKLVRSGVSIRDFKSIIETIAFFCSAERSTFEPSQGLDIDKLLSYIRSQKKRYLFQNSLTHQSTLKVILLSSDSEEYLDRQSNDIDLPQRYESTASSLEIMHFQKLEQIILEFNNYSLCPIVIICKDNLRQRLMDFVSQFGSHIRVFSLKEIDTNFQLERVGVW